MSSSGTIRARAICAFRNAGRILVYPILDCVTGETRWRTFGGTIEFGERSADALRREIREETSQEIEAPKLLGVLESVFEWDGMREHEVSFVFDARFRDPAVYARNELAGVEANGDRLLGRWLALDQFDADTILVPEGLMDLLRR